MKIGSLNSGRSRRLKKQVLRQAVAVNVENLAGNRPIPSRWSGRLRRVSLAGVAVFGVGIALLAWVQHGNQADEVIPIAAAEARGEPVPLDEPSDDGDAGLAPRLDADAAFPLEIRRVVLDPGHGGADFGTVTSDGVYEKDLALDIARRLRDLLKEGTQLEVLMTRKGDQWVPLRDRARIANESKADLFLSIHVNWFEVPHERGVETYFLGPSDDPFVVELARKENRESGYSFADTPALLEGIYVDMRQRRSRRLAEAVQGRLFRSLTRENPEIEDRGVRSAPFLVLIDTEMPAILAEVSCLSNAREAALLTEPLYRQNIAQALYDGLGSYVAAQDMQGG